MLQRFRILCACAVAVTGAMGSLAATAVASTASTVERAALTTSASRLSGARRRVCRMRARHGAARRTRTCSWQPARRTGLARTTSAKRRRRRHPSAGAPATGTATGSSATSSAGTPAAGGAIITGAGTTAGASAGTAPGGASAGTTSGGSGSGSITGGSGSTSGGSGSTTGGSGSTSGGSGSTTGGSGSTTGGSGSAPGTPWPVAAHTETWAYDDCGNGGVGASAGLVRSWVSFAEANCGLRGDVKALGDCHSGGQVYCDVIQYLDTNWVYLNGSPTWPSFSQAAGESWFQHVPGTGARIGTGSYGGGYLINQDDPSAQAFFQNYVRSNYPGEDGLMMDDQAASLNSILYYSTCGCSQSAEVPSSAALQAAHASMSAAMTRGDGSSYLQIDNALPPNPYLPQGLGMLSQSADVHGLISEGSPMFDGHLTGFYSTLLDQIAYVAQQTSSFVVPLSYGQAGASYQAQSRRVQEATILLGYSPGHLVDWADLEQGSHALAVWPEEGIYPTQPVQSMSVPGGAGCLAGTGVVCSTGGHTDLLVAPGVYRREFGACYDQGTAIGACATIVNTTASPVLVPSASLTGTYGHQVTLTGGDVQSGGTINTTGVPFTPGASTIAPHDATILTS
jgi:hypothetical protein